jgi:hypothetical protein
LREGGRVLADETNKAFALINPKADWAFYIQADECVHEKYHDTIKQTLFKFRKNKVLMVRFLTTLIFMEVTIM